MDQISIERDRRQHGEHFQRPRSRRLPLISSKHEETAAHPCSRGKKRGRASRRLAGPTCSSRRRRLRPSARERQLDFYNTGKRYRMRQIRSATTGFEALRGDGGRAGRRPVSTERRPVWPIAGGAACSKASATPLEATLARPRSKPAPEVSSKRRPRGRILQVGSKCDGAGSGVVKEQALKAKSNGRRFGLS